MAFNPSDDLSTLKASAHYWYQRKIGVGIGFFDYRGDSDEHRAILASVDALEELAPGLYR